MAEAASDEKFQLCTLTDGSETANTQHFNPPPPSPKLEGGHFPLQCLRCLCSGANPLQTLLLLTSSDGVSYAENKYFDI